MVWLNGWQAWFYLAFLVTLVQIHPESLVSQVKSKKTKPKSLVNLVLPGFPGKPSWKLLPGKSGKPSLYKKKVPRKPGLGWFSQVFLVSLVEKQYIT